MPIILPNPPAVPAEKLPVILAAKAADTLTKQFAVPKNPAKPVTDNPYNGKVPASVTPDTGLYRSQLGTWVKQDIVFKSQTYTDPITGKQVTSPEIRHYTVLINVTKPTIIKKTEIQGRPGTVKEYIGKGDFQIQINGKIVGPNGVHPTSDVLALNQMEEAPVPIPIVCAYLNDMGVYYIVIEELALTQDPGGISQQNYTINAISDRPVELILK